MSTYGYVEYLYIIMSIKYPHQVLNADAPGKVGYMDTWILNTHTGIHRPPLFFFPILSSKQSVMLNYKEITCLNIED